MKSPLAPLFQSGEIIRGNPPQSPFEKGGLREIFFPERMDQLFGDGMDELLNEMNEPACRDYRGAGRALAA